MGYIEQNIGKDEKILSRVAHSKAALVGAAIYAVFEIILALVIYFGVGALKNYLYDLDPPDFIRVLFDILQIGGVIICCLIALWKIVSCVINIKFNQLVVTNKRLLGRKGAITKIVIDMPLTKLDNIQVNNGFFGALFHYGDLEIISAGSQKVRAGNTVSDLKYPFVKNTEEFRHAVLEAIDKTKAEEREAQARAQAEAMLRLQEKSQTEDKQ